jgi:hypothetical protein
MTSREEIVRFVRQTLGCRCPDEVFNQIECQSGGQFAGKAPYSKRILVGRRLLIYIWETNDPAVFEAELPALVAAGKNERDRYGFNRFRAVIVTEDVARITPYAQRIFRDSRDRDDRVHLHIVHPDNVGSL